MAYGNKIADGGDAGLEPVDAGQGHDSSETIGGRRGFGVFRYAKVYSRNLWSPTSYMYVDGGALVEEAAGEAEATAAEEDDAGRVNARTAGEAGRATDEEEDGGEVALTAVLGAGGAGAAAGEDEEEREGLRATVLVSPALAGGALAIEGEDDGARERSGTTVLVARAPAGWSRVVEGEGADAGGEADEGADAEVR